MVPIVVIRVLVCIPVGLFFPSPFLTVTSQQRFGVPNSRNRRVAHTLTFS